MSAFSSIERLISVQRVLEYFSGMPKIVGIDLGTTNSCMAVMEGTEIKIDGANYLIMREDDVLGIIG